MGAEQGISSIKKHKAYVEHPDRAVERDERFEHVMAISLDPRTDNKDGVIRCIKSREGDVASHGFIDRSVLHKVHGESLEQFTIGERVVMKNEKEIIEQISGKDLDCLGIEDPDIWIDEETGLTQLYFTLPFRNNEKDETPIYLGHAVGKNLDSLEMTMPVLEPDKEGAGAKEVSIAPLNKQGFRYNLVESSTEGEDFTYSTVRVAKAIEMGESWEFGETVFHPAEAKIPWAGGHASPGPLFSEKFIAVGEGKRLGIMNGREANQRVGDEIKYGIFSVGLFIYDYENGKIEWVSPEPLIIDSEARTITFASQFVETGPGTGVLYAHIDDSFVRAYDLNADEIRKLLP